VALYEELMLAGGVRTCTHLVKPGNVRLDIIAQGDSK